MHDRAGTHTRLTAGGARRPFAITRGLCFGYRLSVLPSPASQTMAW